MYQLMFDFLPYVSLSLSRSLAKQKAVDVKLALPWDRQRYYCRVKKTTIIYFSVFAFEIFFFSLFPSIFFHFSFFGSTLPFSFLLYLCVNRLLYVSVYVVSYQTIFRHLCICSSVVHFWLYMQQPIFPAVAAVLMYFNFTLIVFFFYNPVFDICT